MFVSRCSACLHRSADRSENFQSSPQAIVKGPSLDFFCEFPHFNIPNIPICLGEKFENGAIFLLLLKVWSIWKWISFRKVPTNQWLNAQVKVLAYVSPWKASCLGRHPVPCQGCMSTAYEKIGNADFGVHFHSMCDSSVHWITTSCCRNTMRNLRFTALRKQLMEQWSMGLSSQNLSRGTMECMSSIKVQEKKPFLSE